MKVDAAVGWRVAAIVITLALALAIPYRLTDGDLCLYAAMAHDMARGPRPLIGTFDGWSVSTWDFHGAVACFHEHPPGAFWLAALVEKLGAPVETAALAANALWTVAAVAGVIALARHFVSKAAADFAGLAFLLHVAVMKYVGRAGLEIPLAATAAWTLAAGLRLEKSRWWIVATAVALAGAFLVRGVFGLVPAALLVYAAIDRGFRAPWLRVGAVFVLAAGALHAFDRAHSASAPRIPGDCLTDQHLHSFWIAYFQRQVAPSLQPGGTGHSVEGETWTYYVGRTLLYTLPWSLLPLWRLWRGPRPLPSPAAWRLAAVWIVLTVAGASLTSREGSRYVFQVYVATSLLAALAVGPELKPRLAWIASTFVLLVLPAQVLLKWAFHSRDDWWKTAEIAAQHRYRERGLMGPTIHGPFQPEDERLKSLLRFHLGAWTSSRPVSEMKGLQWLPDAGPDFPLGRVVFSTPKGSLVEFDR